MDLNNIVVNGSNITTINFNDIDIETLRFNDNVWNKPSEKEDYYIIGMDTGMSTAEANSLHHALNRRSNVFANCAPSKILIPCKKEVEITAPANSVYSYQYIEGLGYVLTSKYNYWVGGSTDYKTETFILSQNTENETVFTFNTNVDENNHLLFENESVSDIIIYDSASNTNERQLYFYPRIFEDRIKLSELKFGLLNPETGVITYVENTNNISEYTDNFITNLELVKTDAITFNMTYNISENKTKNFRKAFLVIDDGYPQLLLTIVQRPNV